MEELAQRRWKKYSSFVGRVAKGKPNIYPVLAVTHL
jgi:hypothetical protein